MKFNKNQRLFDTPQAAGKAITFYILGQNNILSYLIFVMVNFLK
jgi:hypothetical protein